MKDPIEQVSRKVPAIHTHYDIHWQKNVSHLKALFLSLYSSHPDPETTFDNVCQVVKNAALNRPDNLSKKDKVKLGGDKWFLSNHLSGMSLYVDRFCGSLNTLPSKLDYLQELGISLLHLMPLFESPAHESDGGYAVSNFRKIDPRFGNLEELAVLIKNMQDRNMHVMLDIVLNHTSHQHEWAMKAKAGDPFYQQYYYMYDTVTLPNEFDLTMPDIFPESAPGNFTYIPECKKWVMTVFHQYQWDLNFSNPYVLAEMIDTIFFYANIGVDVLRIDAPAFIWKKMGTTSQNLPEAHTLLRFIKGCVEIASPGMALLGEAIVAPVEIMKYLGEGDYEARECDLAYNATMMALQWDALATGKTKVMRAGHKALTTKPLNTSWINYTRCHDDIGLGFSDEDIRQGGFVPYHHREFLQSYYAGSFPGSKATGALFSVNPKIQDARISGSLASLCGLESALKSNDQKAIVQALNKIILMQAQSIFFGGIPMLFYGDEVGYTNDYSYQKEPDKAYDNRWMHRPLIDWSKNARIHLPGTIEYKIFHSTKNLLALRSKFTLLSDKNNFEWMPDENVHLCAFVRAEEGLKFFCLFNYGEWPVYISWFMFKPFVSEGQLLYDEWGNKNLTVGTDQEHLIIPGYGFVLARSL